MGLDRTIRFPTHETPPWEGIRAALSRFDEDFPLRMIDGLPAFPDETPDPAWKELRVGTSGGMVTLRRGAGTVTCVVWGNADPGLLAGFDRLCWAVASAGAGAIATPSGPQAADEFAHSVGIALCD